MNDRIAQLEQEKALILKTERIAALRQQAETASLKIGIGPVCRSRI